MKDKTNSPVADKIASMPIRVSLVEDDIRARRIFGDWLSQADGISMLGAFEDAESAIEALPQQAPDVVLMDISLPGRNGIECVRQIRASMQATQFVMLTVYEDADRIFEALSAGAAGYLLKQTPRAELLAAIKQVFQGGSPMSGVIARKVVQFFQRPLATTDKTAELSDREREVLALLIQGYLYKEIAEALKVSYTTVTTYGRRIYEKLQVHSRAQAVALFGHSSPKPGIS
jgi:DNA-binding NarL/FixJ family response regulator